MKTVKSSHQIQPVCGNYFVNSTSDQSSTSCKQLDSMLKVDPCKIYNPKATQIITHIDVGCNSDFENGRSTDLEADPDLRPFTVKSYDFTVYNQSPPRYLF